VTRPFALDLDEAPAKSRPAPRPPERAKPVAPARPPRREMTFLQLKDEWATKLERRAAEQADDARRAREDANAHPDSQSRRDRAIAVQQIADRRLAIALKAREEFLSAQRFEEETRWLKEDSITGSGVRQ
jgi:hypothetical protein